MLRISEKPAVGKELPKTKFGKSNLGDSYTVGQHTFKTVVATKVHKRTMSPLVYKFLPIHSYYAELFTRLATWVSPLFLSEMYDNGNEM